MEAWPGPWLVLFASLAHLAPPCAASGSYLSYAANLTMAGDAMIACPDVCRMRLTTDNPSLRGGAWSKKFFNVSKGFATTFTVQFLDRGSACTEGREFTEYCLTRGGNGLAFVIYGEDDAYGAITDVTHLLGGTGGGLGYEGLKNSIVVEFDMTHDRIKGDLYENHIGIMTGGRLRPVSSDHRYSLGSTANVPEFGFERAHQIKIVYKPIFDEDDILHSEWCLRERSCDKFQNNAYFTELLQTSHFPHGRIGTMHVYVDDWRYPRLIVPMEITSVLDLVQADHVRVGFTGTTGYDNWQKQDVYNWTMCTGQNYTYCQAF